MPLTTTGAPAASRSDRRCSQRREPRTWRSAASTTVAARAAPGRCGQSESERGLAGAGFTGDQQGSAGFAVAGHGLRDREPLGRPTRQRRAQRAEAAVGDGAFSDVHDGDAAGTVLQPGDLHVGVARRQLDVDAATAGVLGAQALHEGHVRGGQAGCALVLHQQPVRASATTGPAGRGRRRGTRRAWCERRAFGIHHVLAELRGDGVREGTQEFGAFGDARGEGDHGEQAAGQRVPHGAAGAYGGAVELGEVLIAGDLHAPAGGGDRADAVGAHGLLRQHGPADRAETVEVLGGGAIVGPPLEDAALRIGEQQPEAGAVQLVGDARERSLEHLQEVAVEQVETDLRDVADAIGRAERSLERCHEVTRSGRRAAVAEEALRISFFACSMRRAEAVVIFDSFVEDGLARPSMRIRRSGCDGRAVGCAESTPRVGAGEWARSVLIQRPRRGARARRRG